MVQPAIELSCILPALILCVAGLVILFLGVLVRTGILVISCLVSLLAVAVAMVYTWPIPGAETVGFSGLIVMDSFTRYFNVVILISVALTALLSLRYLSDEEMEMYEYFVLLLFAGAGMMFMVSANHIMVLFLGLETLSISVYVLAGVLPTGRSKEAALKYLIMGGFSSGVFLYGAALLYGAAGSLGLDALTQYFASGSPSLMAKLGMGMLLVGFAFKAAVVPFHMWTPDVYEGAPTPVTAYMSVAVKAAAIAAFVRVFFESLTALQVDWSQVLWLLAALTMIVGNIVAVAQDNIKRMLAYSSIAHAGYILIGMVAGGQLGTSGILYYLLAYTFTNVGAFGVVALVGRKGEANNMLDDYRGLARAHPALALTMAIFLFSLAGIPPTAGFIGKLTIFRAALEGGYVWLVIIGVLTSAVSVFYYFRVIMKMYMEAPEREPAELQFGPGTVIALLVSAVGVLYIGLFPSTYLNLAVESVKPLF